MAEKLTIAQQLEAALARVAEVEAAAMEAATVAAARIAELETASAEVQSAREGDAATVAEAGRQLTAVRGALAVSQVEIAAKDAELTKVKAALANPAHMDAAIGGLAAATADGAPAEEDEPLKPEYETREEALAVYHELDTPAGRQQFRVDNKKILGL